jgi:hypothetical protein
MTQATTKNISSVVQVKSWICQYRVHFKQWKYIGKRRKLIGLAISSLETALFFYVSFYFTISLLHTIITICVVNLKLYTICYMSCRVIFQWIFSNHIFWYLWNGIYDNLVVESAGLNLFNLLGSSSSSSSVDVSSFGCVTLPLYLTLNFVISFLTVAIFKTECRSLFGICIRWSVYACSDVFILISLQYFNVWITSGTPEGYTVCPDGL